MISQISKFFGAHSMLICQKSVFADCLKPYVQISKPRGLRSEQRKAPAADANADGAVSIAEAFAYARDRAMALANSYEVEQNAQSNAAGCTAFSPFR